MINYENLNNVIREMDKMKKLIDAVLENDVTVSDYPATLGYHFVESGRRTGAVRRQSMELSNALVNLRKSR